MRILLLAPYFFPYTNPRAHRWTAIAREWAQRGWEVHVVCSRDRNWPVETEWEGIHIHRTGFNSAKELAYNFFPKMPRRGAQLLPPPKAKSSQFPRKLNEWLLKSWYWPDDAWIWIPAARKKAKHVLKKGHWDALISTSLPFSAHWVAKNLKAQFPKLFWLADIGDPFSLQKEHPLNNQRLFQRKNESAERAVLQTADQVVVTNKGLEEAYRESFPSIKTSIQVIPPLVSPQAVNKSVRADSEILELGYFGSFFQNIREPEFLLRFLEKNLCEEQRWRLFSQRRHLYSERWRLHLYGPIFEEFWPIFERFPNLRRHLHFHGTLPRDEVINRMQKMDVLVMLGNTTSFQLPSKWADYLVAGRPVLHLMQTPQDPALPMIEKEDQVLSLPIGGADERLLPFLESAKDWSASEAQIKKWRKQFSAPTIAAAYAALLKV